MPVRPFLAVLVLVVASMTAAERPSAAQSGPPPGATRFVGTITINGAPPPDGTKVRAITEPGPIVPGTQNPARFQCGVGEVRGGRYALDTDPGSRYPVCRTDGTTVQLLWDSSGTGNGLQPAQQIGVLQAGATITLDLVVTQTPAGAAATATLQARSSLDPRELVTALASNPISTAALPRGISLPAVRLLLPSQAPTAPHFSQFSAAGNVYYSSDEGEGSNLIDYYVFNVAPDATSYYDDVRRGVSRENVTVTQGSIQGRPSFCYRFNLGELYSGCSTTIDNVYVNARGAGLDISTATSLLNSGVTHLKSVMSGGTQAPDIPNGTIIQGSGSDLFVVYDGARHRIPDDATLRTIDRSGRSPRLQVEDETLAAIRHGRDLPSVLDIQPDLAPATVAASSAQLPSAVVLRFEHVPNDLTPEDFPLLVARVLSVYHGVIISGAGCLIPQAAIVVAAAHGAIIPAIYLTGLNLGSNPFCRSLILTMIEMASGVEGTSLADQ
jgi:hypothetical protein